MPTLLQEKLIGNIIKKTIVESFYGIFTDPDFGLELKSDIAKRLKKYSLKTPKKMATLSEIKKKYS